MDKKEFIKALAIVGLVNTLVVAVLAGLIYLIVLAIVTVPFTVLTILFFVIVGYISAFIYLKLKEKEK